MGKYVALLRGINIGGHHKIAMKDVRTVLERIGLKNVVTILNSGNIIFDSISATESGLDEEISGKIGEIAGFPVPVMVRTAEELLQIARSMPFKGIEINSNIQLYVTFLKNFPDKKIDLPWISDDGHFRIIDIQGRAVFSYVDLSLTRTTKGMSALEQLFGKNITSRNWNTLMKIAEKLLRS